MYYIQIYYDMRLIRHIQFIHLCFQDPFYLERTVICSDQDLDQEYFEIHEFGSKDSYIFKVIIFIFKLIVSNFLSQTYSLFLADSKRKVPLKCFT